MKQLLILTCLLCIFQASAQKTWELAVQKKNIKIWTKTYDQKGIKQFKAETIFNANIKTVVAALMDVEASSKWYDMVEKVTVLKRISDTEAIYRIDFDFPALTSNRYTVVRASIKKEETSGDYIVKTKYENHEIVKDNDRVFVNKLESEWRLTAIDENTTKIYHAAFMDPNGSIPAWMVNQSVTSGPVKTITGLNNILPKYKGVAVKI